MNVWFSLVVALAFAAGTAQAQQTERACIVQPYRGASSPQGSVAKLSMVNRGQPCRLENYGVPDERANPAYQGRITVSPMNGTATFVAVELPCSTPKSPTLSFQGKSSSGDEDQDRRSHSSANHRP